MMTKENALTLIDWVIKTGGKLNAWERIFVSKINRKSLLAPLSKKDEAIVLGIYERRSAPGGGKKVFHEIIKAEVIK